jgi:hypothetical protein
MARMSSTVRGGDVEKDQLVRALAVIDLRLGYRVACVDQIDEVDALDHAPVFHIQAGNHALRQH